MPKSLNRYVDPKTGAILVDVGDELTPDVVKALGRVGAERVRFENLPFAQQMLLSHRQGLLLGIGEEEDEEMQAPMPDATVAALIIGGLCITYCAAVVLGLAVSRCRDQRSRNKEKENKDATD